MNHTDNTNEKMANEIAALRKQISELEKTEKEHNKMVDTLKKERNFSSAVIDTVGALVVVLDRQGRIVSFNKACENTTGYESREVFSRYIWDVFILPDERKQVQDIFVKLISSKSPSKFENYWLTKDGKRRLIAWANSILLDDDNSVEFVIGTGIDITDHKQAEEALKESEKKYREIIEESHDMIWTFDTRGNFTFINQQITSLIGYKIEDVKGKEFGAYIYPDDLKIAQEAFRNTMEGKPQRNSMRVYKSDGSVFRMLFTLSPVYNKGKIEGGIGFGIDISAYQSMEEALNKSEKRYQALAEAAHDMIFIIDEHYQVHYVNSFGAKQFDAQPSDIIGKPLEQLFPAAANRMKANIQKVFDTKAPLCVSNKTIYPKKELWIETWLSPIMSPDNTKVVSVMGIARDITEWEKAKNEIIQSKQILETVTDGISDSTFLISNDFRIIWANKAAIKQTGRSLQDLKGTLCHEITHNSKTPCQEPNDTCPIKAVLKTGKTLTVKHTHTDKNGQKKTIEVTAYPIKDSSGEIIQFVHIGREIKSGKM